LNTLVEVCSFGDKVEIVKGTHISKKGMYFGNTKDGIGCYVFLENNKKVKVKNLAWVKKIKR